MWDDGEEEELTSDISPPEQQQDNDQRVYFVPYKWWKEAKDSCSEACDLENNNKEGGVLYTAVQASTYGGPLKIFNMFYSDLMFNLIRDNTDCLLQSNKNGEVGISGREYALVHGDMWLEALKWHSSRNATKDGKSFSQDEMSDVYPLQLRLSVLQERKSLGIKISKKDNTIERFRRACKIFSPVTEPLRIWDFSGKTTTYLLNDESKAATDTQAQLEDEFLLELQVYGLSDFGRSRDAKKDDGKLFFLDNGTYSSSARGHPQGFSAGSGESGSLGLTGLQNLGNTCFLNSALQCLAHTPKLIDYFLGDYFGEINHNNPLGMDGEIALAFGDLLRKLWAPGATALAPRVFKSKLSRFAPQFNGFNQHDSQELLAFLLDGLHEDLNRVKCKPYAEVKDGDGRPDGEVADEYWHNHLARNDSIIVDVCQGQYRSTLVCPVCQKVSVTFDPFMYLSLPLPSTTTRRMTLTLISTDGSTAPSPFTITMPKLGKFEDLIGGLTTACSFADEKLLVAEVYNSRIIRYLRESNDSLSLIRDDDRLVVYRLPKHTDNVRSVVFMHQHAEETYVAGKLVRSWKAFGIPLVASFNLSSGSDICNFYLQSLRAFGISGDEFVNGDDKNDVLTLNEVTGAEDASTFSLVGGTDSDHGERVDGDIGAKLAFYITDEKAIVMNEITTDWLIESTVHERLNVLVRWPAVMFKQYESRLLRLLPPVFKFDFSAKTPQDSVTLYKCLEGFLKEEPLGPDDMWFCPSCKEHCQASKKLDLWRLPEILVIHLKRFSYNRFSKNKLEIYVDFPVHDLDLSEYICYRNGQSSNRYMLYAMSNHYGGMGGGHYTAFVRHGGDQWYDFDDSRVSAINEDKIKTSAAYVLFFRRVEC